MQAGSVFALEDEDWIFHPYRESAIGLLRGMPARVVLQWWRVSIGVVERRLQRRVDLRPDRDARATPPGSRGEEAARQAVAIAYFGDGATSKGSFHEGANFAAVMRALVLFCNNSKWAISTPLSARTAAETLADKAVGYRMPGVRVDGGRGLRGDPRRGARARGGDGPTLIEAVTPRRAARHRRRPARASISRRVEEEEERVRRPLRALPEAARRSRRGGRGADPRRVMTMRTEFPRRRQSRRPTYRSCSSTHMPRRAAAARRGARELGDPRWLSSLVEAINDCFHVELERDDDVMVMGEDVGRAGGVFRATAGLLDRFGRAAAWTRRAGRSRDHGHGRRALHGRLAPGVPHCSTTFSYPALDQLITHVGRYRWRTGGGMSFPLVVRMPYGGGVRAPELHDDSPETYYVHTPGVKVAIPSTPADAKGLLAAAIRSDDPVVVLDLKLHYRTLRGRFRQASTSSSWARRGSRARGRTCR